MLLEDIMLPKDPSKHDCYRHKRKEISQRLAQDPVWRANNKEAMQKRAKDPEYQRIQKEAIQKRSQNPRWRHNHKRAMQMIAQDPEWKRKHMEGIRKRTLDLKWLSENKERLQKLAQDPEFIHKRNTANRERFCDPGWLLEQKRASQKRVQTPEWQLNHKEGLLGGFWYGNVRYPDPPKYCELWCPDLWHRIDEAQNYQSILSGKTKFDNGGHALSRHHVYWQPGACCKWNEDSQGYYVRIDIGTRKHPNEIKYHIPGDPNKFVLLTKGEHDMIRKNKLAWIKIFENLITTKLGGVCYLPKFQEVIL